MKSTISISEAHIDNISDTCASNDIDSILELKKKKKIIRYD